VPESVRTLLHEHVEGYEQLETLLLFVPEPRQEWTAASAANALRVSVQTTADALEHLHATGLLEPQPGGAYRFAPRAEPHHEALVALERLCSQDRLAIMELMSAHALERLRLSALRTLAEAFRLRRRKP
jgi:hypothetical protein